MNKERQKPQRVQPGEDFQISSGSKPQSQECPVSWQVCLGSVPYAEEHVFLNYAAQCQFNHIYSVIMTVHTNRLSVCGCRFGCCIKLTNDQHSQSDVYCLASCLVGLLQPGTQEQTHIHIHPAHPKNKLHHEATPMTHTSITLVPD